MGGWAPHLAPTPGPHRLDDPHRTASARRPLRARITRPPPPKLLGEVGVGLGVVARRRGLRCAGRGPLPRPLFARSSWRGEDSSALRQVRAASAGAPSGSLRLATSPKTAGGGWDGAGGGGSAKGITLRRTDPPLPRPLRLFLAERGRIRARSGQSTILAAPPPATWQALSQTAGPPVREGGLRVVVAANSFALAHPCPPLAHPCLPGSPLIPARPPPPPGHPPPPPPPAAREGRTRRWRPSRRHGTGRRTRRRRARPRRAGPAPAPAPCRRGGG